jgi:hypothetical protein
MHREIANKKKKKKNLPNVKGGPHSLEMQCSASG